MYEVVFASKRVGKTLDRLPAKQKQQIVHDIENKLRTLNFLTKGVKHRKRQINRTPTKSPTQRECWLNQAKRPDSKSSNDSLGMLQGKRNR